MVIGGKTTFTGTGSITRDGKTYVVQTVEVTNADNTTFRRISDCATAKKK